MEKILRETKVARGVLIVQNHVLLAQDIRPGQGHFFLPGGNVESGEAVRMTLIREWQEELGWTIEVGAFAGCLENIWSYKRKQDGVTVDVLEMNFLFQISGVNTDLNQQPTSKEEHLKFSWVPIGSLSSIKLLPLPLKNILPAFVENPPNAIWESNLKP